MGDDEAPVRRPLLSVVVPVYNVERYLEECLDSLADQAYTNLEVILVDDGSTDTSASICRTYVERDERFRLVQQENSGLGAARNRGVAECRGEFLTFVDSDDSLPDDAYKRMMLVLLRSGSDFVVGSIARGAHGDYREPAWVRRLHSHRQVGVTVEEVPDVLANIFAWNKIFRRSFWDAADLGFPVGVHYEDQVPITRAYLESDKFDIVSAVVYRWRTREDGSSITQRRAELEDLRQRLEVKREAGRLIRGYESSVVRASWFAKVLRYDMPSYCRAALETGPEYWEHLVAGIAELTSDLPDSTWRTIPVELRLSAFLVASDRRDDYARLLSFLDNNTRGFAVRERDGRRIAVLPLVEEIGSTIAPLFFEVTDVDTQMHSRLTGIQWVSDHEIRLRGGAFLSHLGREAGAIRIGITCHERKSGADVSVEVSQRDDPGINAWSGRAWQDHSNAGFEATVDVVALLGDRSLERGSLTWDVVVDVSVAGFAQSGPIRSRAAHSSARELCPSLVSGKLVTPRWAGKLGLSVGIRDNYAVLSSVSADREGVDLEVLSGPERLVGSLVLTEDGKPVTRLPGERTGPSRTRHRVNRADLPVAWQGVAVELSHDSTQPVKSVAREPLSTLGTEGHQRGVSVWTHPDGSVFLGQVPGLVADSVAFDETSVTIRGTGHGADSFTCALVGPRNSTSWVGGQVVDGRFEVTVPTRSAQRGIDSCLLQDSYSVEVVAGDMPASAMLVAEDLGSSPPQRHDVGGTRWDVEVQPEGGMGLRKQVAWHPDEEGQLAQRRLQAEVYQASRRGARRPVVMLECFNGKAVGDSPGAISEVLASKHPQLDLVWSVADQAVTVPAGSRSVLRHTRDWYEALGSAAFIVSNNNFPAFFHKAPGQVHLQTWHGTPLKRIGHDVENLQFTGKTYLSTMDAEAANWDYLISPSPYCTEIFPRAFAYSGPILELGYPRNDVLVAPGHLETRARVRAGLGIGDDQRVVLYAPTWRETARTGNTYDKVFYLDAEEVTAAVADVVVLVRGHTNTAGQPSASAGASSRVMDVTMYQDGAELFLAADVLVTDYSSVMFDFALTGRPIVLLVPDLEVYRDRTRGFYFDLERHAPGPLLRSTQDVITHLLDPAPDRYTDKRAAFIAKFSPYDDGKAADRVVEAVFHHAALHAAGLGRVIETEAGVAE